MKNIAGKSFGRLLVLKRSENISTFAGWLCVCTCGVQTKVSGASLRSGDTRSCGCLRREAGAKTATHGMSYSKEYRIWMGMRVRCDNPSSKDYPNYGGRGIYVCKRWESFKNFYADMGPCPPKKSLDRRDTNGPYSPNNCRWRTAKQQHENMRGNVKLTFAGQTLCVSQWADKLSLPRDLVYKRVAAGWSAKKALITPSRKGVRFL